MKHTKKIVRSAVLASVGLAAVAGAIKLTTGGLASAAYQKYDYDAWIFYDPVNGGSNCNEINYWTPFNTNTTCYRWFLVGEDNTSNPNLKLILDHDLGKVAYANASSVLAESVSNWDDYHGNTPRLITEDEIMAAMGLGLNRDDCSAEVPCVDKPNTEQRFSVRKNISGTNLYNMRLMTNTKYYVNGTLHDNVGFWSQTTYNNDSVCPNSYSVYAVDDGVNTLTCNDTPRGVRPIIEVGKSKLNTASALVDITSNVFGAAEYKYWFEYDGSRNIYANLQGFTVTNDKLVFYSPDSRNESDPGKLFGYGGSGLGTAVDGTPMNVSMGHGNDMTYNTNTDEILITGPSSDSKVGVFDNDTLASKGEITVAGGNTVSSIGYDNFNNKYVGSTRYGISELGQNFNMINSFVAPQDASGQGMEYHNGYVYSASVNFSDPCPNYYQLYCSNVENYGGVINVYDMRLNSDGTPVKTYGKRVKRFLANGWNRGEIESISFRNGDAWIGYATKNFDSNYQYKFYRLNDDLLEIPLATSVSFDDTTTSTTVRITADAQIYDALPGYTLSSDGYTLTKTVDTPTVSDDITICDIYMNCGSVQYSHTNSSMVEKTFTLTFDANGGSYSTSTLQCATYGTSCNVTIPNTAPTRGGFTFLGWADNASATEPIHGTSVTLSSDKTIYAVWQEDIAPPIIMFTLYFDLNGGVGEIEDQQCDTTTGSCMVYIPNTTAPTRDNYTFLGWAESSSATAATAYPGQGITLTDNKTLYAVWQENVIPPEPGPDPEPTPPEGTGEINWVQGQTYEKGDGENPIFRIDYPADKFVSLKIDDTLVDTEDYTAIAGSTVISINHTFVDTLATGEHTITANYTADTTVTTTFSVTEKVVPPEPGPDPDPDPDPDPEPTPTPEPDDPSGDIIVPDTGRFTDGDGDAMAMVAVATFAVLAGTGVVLYRVQRKKEHFVFDK